MVENWAKEVEYLFTWAWQEEEGGLFYVFP